MGAKNCFKQVIFRQGNAQSYSHSEAGIVMICNFEDYWLVTKEYLLVVSFVTSMQRKGIRCHVCLWCRGITVLWTADLLSIEKATSWETSVTLDVTQLLFPTKIIANERMGKSLAGILCPSYSYSVEHMAPLSVTAYTCSLYFLEIN